jgi:hypothetical protein
MATSIGEGTPETLAAYETFRRSGRDVIVSTVRDEHPTNIGQFVKSVAIAVVQRADYNPDWKPWDGFTRPLCRIDRNVNYSEFSDKAWEHPEHDGRLDCSTVVGAILMARQSFI